MYYRSCHVSAVGFLIFKPKLRVPESVGKLFSWKLYWVAVEFYATNINSEPSCKNSSTNTNILYGNQAILTSYYRNVGIIQNVTAWWAGQGKARRNNCTTSMKSFYSPRYYMPGGARCKQVLVAARCLIPPNT